MSPGPRAMTPSAPLSACLNQSLQLQRQCANPLGQCSNCGLTHGSISHKRTNLKLEHVKHYRALIGFNQSTLEAWLIGYSVPFRNQNRKVAGSKINPQARYEAKYFYVYITNNTGRLSHNHFFEMW